MFIEYSFGASVNCNMIFIYSFGNAITTTINGIVTLHYCFYTTRVFTRVTMTMLNVLSIIVVEYNERTEKYQATIKLSLKSQYIPSISKIMFLT